MVNSLLVVTLVVVMIISTNAYKVDIIHKSYSDYLEGPHWDVQKQSLYYIHLFGKVVRYDYLLKKVFYATVEYEKFISFIIPIEGTRDEFAVGIGRRIGLIQWDGISPKVTLLRILVEVENEPRFYRNSFDDAKADPRGRFFGGTMGIVFGEDYFLTALGSLYSGYLSNGTLKNIKKYVHISNGLAWNKEADTCYYIDTGTLEVKAYNYSIDTGEITNERTVISFYEFNKEPKFRPDGMTIDTNGNLYFATFKSNIVKVNPRTNKVVVIKMPVNCITTSVSFGGPNLDMLFVTSFANEKNPKLAGFLFKITGLTQGSPAHKLKLY